MLNGKIFFVRFLQIFGKICVNFERFLQENPELLQIFSRVLVGLKTVRKLNLGSGYLTDTPLGLPETQPIAYIEHIIALILFEFNSKFVLLIENKLILT